MAISNNGNEILVTGSRGYIGSHLVPELLSKGYSVRAMGRKIKDLDSYDWLKDVEAVQADVLEPKSLVVALSGVDAAYYLIHSMAAGKGFEQRDFKAAKNFAEAAKTAGVILLPIEKSCFFNLKAIVSDKYFI